MQKNLAGRPYIEILILAEKAVESGATVEYTVQYLGDSGVSAETAQECVDEAIR